MKTVSTAIMAISMVVTPASAATQNPTLQNAVKVRALFASIKPNSPGCAVGVEKDGQTLFAEGFGSADLTSKAPITPQTNFYLASMSKQITAMNVVMLAREGKLDLHASIRRYIPELPDYMEPVTIFDMLQHTSGLRDYLEIGALANLGDYTKYTEKDVIDGIKRQKRLNFAPGSQYLYSNTGYVLSVIAAERVSGMSFSELSRKQLFEPLNMTATRYQQDHTSPIQSMANGYEPSGDGFNISNRDSDTVGDGGVYSNIGDLLKWVVNFDTGIVGSEALRAMQVEGVLGDGSLTKYGMGLVLGTYRGLMTISHGGAFVGYRTADVWFPTEKLGAVVLCNSTSMNPGGKVLEVAAVFLSHRMTPLPTLAGTAGYRPSVAEEEAIVGRYRSESRGYAELKIQGDALRLVGIDAPLKLIGPRRFAWIAGDQVTEYAFEGGAHSTGFYRSLKGEPSTHFSRIDGSQPTVAEQKELIGTYASDELPSVYRISANGPGLQVSIAGHPAFRLTKISQARYLIEDLGAEIQFPLGASGVPQEFILDSSRSKHFVFHRQEVQ